MAKDEKSEKEHFNNLFNTIDFDNVRFTPDFDDHPDNKLIYEGVKMLGTLENKKILLLGCGAGKEAWYFASKSAQVTGIDIAFNYLRIAKFGARKYNFDKHANFAVMSVYKMGFGDEYFDLIFGHAILHHLDLSLIGPEISRVLKKSGCAVFTEPLDSNFLLRFARDHLPYPGKHRVKNEKAITYNDIKQLSKFFHSTQKKELQFLSMIIRLLPNKPLISFLEKVDRVLFSIFPPIRTLCRAISIKFTKD